MARLLTINGTRVDIDSKTAIGINFQAYNITTPSVRRVSASNSFTIPSTSHNLAIFGNPLDIQSVSNKIYDRAICSYWVDNEPLITDAAVRVDLISDRISLFVYQKKSVWDEMKLFKWSDFVVQYIDWLHAEKGVPSETNPMPYNGNFDLFVKYLTSSTDAIHLAHYYGNLYTYAPDEQQPFDNVEDRDNINLLYNQGGKVGYGGHISTYYKNVFEFIEYKYGVDFLTSRSDVVGNIWNDPIASKTYFPLRQLNPAVTINSGSINGIFLQHYENTTDDNIGFLPNDDIQDKAGKTLYDCVNVFMQTFNIVIDELDEYTRLARFDDLKTLADVQDWSTLADTPISLKPLIDGYAIENTIRYSSVYENGDTNQGRKVLTCVNLNLNASIDLFSIDAHIPAFKGVNNADNNAIDNSTKESFKTFEVLIDSGVITGNVNYTHGVGTEPSGTKLVSSATYNQAAIYTIKDEYVLIDELLNAPKTYEVQKWLTLADVHNLEYFKLYYIRELNGSFFINKISGFNPELSNKPTKIELIRISDRTPSIPTERNYWVDGIGDYWADGVNDLFY